MVLFMKYSGFFDENRWFLRHFFVYFDNVLFENKQQFRSLVFSPIQWKGHKPKNCKDVKRNEGVGFLRKISFRRP